MDRRRTATLLLASSLLVGAIVPASSSASPVVILEVPKDPEPCFDSKPGVHKLRIPMRLHGGGRGVATGRYALPSTYEPKGLVLFDHGYGHTSASWVHHMKNAARRGLIAVALDYRGIEIKRDDDDDDRFPESRGWNVMKGAEDTVVAAQVFERRCPSVKKIVVFSVSMGSNTGGLAVALASTRRRPNGKPLFDYWVNVEGAVNVIETYLGARALAPVNDFAAQAQEDIEKEMGGPIEEKPQTYVDHAVVSHVPDIKASGVKGVITIHGVDDGLVPYNQAREITALLTQNRVPNDLYTVGRESKKTDDDTTATGYVGNEVDPNYDSPIAGHASETSKVHIVMVTAFKRLWGLFKGDEVGPAREFLVDGEAGTFPAS